MLPKTRPAPPTGSYAWRRDRDLLTIGDLVMRYRASRWPRGPYRAPMPEDAIVGRGARL